MPHLVDSDVLIAQREGDPDALDLPDQLAPQGLAISIITYMEVYQGTLGSPELAQERFEHLLIVDAILPPRAGGRPPLRWVV